MTDRLSRMAQRPLRLGKHPRHSADVLWPVEIFMQGLLDRRGDAGGCVTIAEDGLGEGGSCRSDADIDVHAARIAAVSVPARRPHPQAAISHHSETSRRITVGTPAKNASRCTPPNRSEYSVPAAPVRAFPSIRPARPDALRPANSAPPEEGLILGHVPRMHGKDHRQ